MVITALVFGSCSKQQRTEKKLVDAMLSDDYETSFQAISDYSDWVKSDISNMTYNFSYSREKLGAKVNTSSDGKLRSLSWVTNHGEVYDTYANILIWTVNGNLIGFNGPLDAMLTGRKPSIKHQWSLAHSIDTIYDIQDATQPIYMFVESYVNEEGKTFTYISAAINQGLKLSIMPFFFDGIETAGNRPYVDDGHVDKSQLIKWDNKTKMLYCYVTDDNERVIPGQYEQYALSSTQFVKVKKEENEENQDNLN